MDKRALLTGILGGLIFSVVPAWLYYGPEWDRLQAAYGPRWTMDFLLLCGIFGCLVLPGAVSALAREHPFAWGLLPLTLFWVSVDGVQGCTFGWSSIPHTLPATIIVLGVCLLLSSGSVAFARAALEKRRQAAEEQARWERREAARHFLEEVWPPPPKPPSPQ